MKITQSNYQTIGAPIFRKLSEDQLERMHFASLEILERTGVRLHLPEAVELLRKAGAEVTGGNRVRIPASLVEWALSVAPKRVVLANRNGDRVMPLERNNVFYGPGSDCPNIIDFRTGERRPRLWRLTGDRHDHRRRWRPPCRLRRAGDLGAGGRHGKAGAVARRLLLRRMAA